MSINPIVLSIPIYFILIVIEWVVDASQKKKRYQLGDVIANIGCGITEQATAILSKVVLIAIYTYIYTHFKLWEVPHTWYWAVVLFIAVDFFYYWAHRKSHEINLFWVGHVVHHQSEDYNLSVALRQGTFQKFFTAPFFWPLAILGFDPIWFLLASAFVTLYQFWIHTQYIDKMGWFEYVFNTPSHHRVHHGRDEKYLDKNHAGTFIIWDRIFGTFKEEEETPNFGVTTQLQTFNPINATLIPFKELGKKIQSVSGFSNKLKAVFYGPGWNPMTKELSPEITHKYTVQYTSYLIVYISILFLEIIAFSAALLFNSKSLSNPEILSFTGVLLFTMWSVGNLADNKSYAMWIEIGRVLVIVFFWFIFQIGKYNDWEIWGLSAIFVSLFLLALIIPKKEFSKG